MNQSLDYYYSSYGFLINSAVELQVLSVMPAESNPDVTVTASAAATTHDTEPQVSITGPEGSITVSEGQRITVESNPAYTTAQLRPYVLSAGFGALFHQRDCFPLHASTFVIDGSAVCFLGDSGAGKSTLAAAFYDRGYGIVNDDIAVIDRKDNDESTARPGYPALKLERDSPVTLDENSWTEPGLEKPFIEVPRNFPTQSLPVKRIYVLREGEEHRTEPLSLQSAVRELIAHTYRPELLEQAGRQASHLEHCGKLAESIPVVELYRPVTSSELTRTVEFVLDDLDG